jgi:hypothetical protein
MINLLADIGGKLLRDHILPSLCAVNHFCRNAAKQFSCVIELITRPTKHFPERNALFERLLDSRWTLAWVFTGFARSSIIVRIRFNRAVTRISRIRTNHWQAGLRLR